MKVYGVPGPDGKNFNITHNGQTYLAERKGQRFCCCGFVGTLKEIKAAILAERLHTSVGSVHDSEPGHLSDEPKDCKTSPLRSAWDCVDPCAILIYFCFDSPADVATMSESMRKTVLETLGCNGWLGADNSPDIAKMNREFSRVNRSRETS